jgi:hypothetical protein
MSTIWSVSALIVRTAIIATTMERWRAVDLKLGW